MDHKISVTRRLIGVPRTSRVEYSKVRTEKISMAPAKAAGSSPSRRTYREGGPEHSAANVIRL